MWKKLHSTCICQSTDSVQCRDTIVILIYLSPEGRHVRLSLCEEKKKKKTRIWRTKITIRSEKEDVYENANRGRRGIGDLSHKKIDQVLHPVSFDDDDVGVRNRAPVSRWRSNTAWTRGILRWFIVLDYGYTRWPKRGGGGGGPSSSSSGIKFPCTCI